MKKYFLSFLLGIAIFAGFAQEDSETLLSSTPAEAATKATATADSVQCKTPIYGLRTNTLSWLTLAPNLEFEASLGKHWNVAVGGGYGWWGFTGDQKALQTWTIDTEARYYFRASQFNGSSLGLRFATGQFDVLLETNGRRGKYGTIGINYAYTWYLGEKHNWFLDAGLGVGYFYRDYTKYTPNKLLQSYDWKYNKTIRAYGLTSVFLNIGYRFPVE